jgi:hypothetical protein
MTQDFAKWNWYVVLDLDLIQDFYNVIKNKDISHREIVLGIYKNLEISLNMERLDGFDRLEVTIKPVKGLSLFKSENFFNISRHISGYDCDGKVFEFRNINFTRFLNYVDELISKCFIELNTKIRNILTDISNLV